MRGWGVGGLVWWMLVEEEEEEGFPHISMQIRQIRIFPSSNIQQHLGYRFGCGSRSISAPIDWIFHNII